MRCLPDVNAQVTEDFMFWFAAQTDLKFTVIVLVCMHPFKKSMISVLGVIGFAFESHVFLVALLCLCSLLTHC